MTGGRVFRDGIRWGADNDRSDVDADEIRCLHPRPPRCLPLVAYLLLFFLIVTIPLFSAIQLAFHHRALHA